MRRVPFSSIVLAVLLACALMLRPLDAQPRALAGTTLTTTDTTANSVLVGCSPGSTTCTGGIKSGPISATTIAGTTGTFTDNLQVANNKALNTLGSGAAVVNLASLDSSFNYLFGGSANANNTVIAAPTAISFRTGGVDRGSVSSAGLLNWVHAVAYTGTIAPSALANGDNNNYNPTNLASSTYVILTADAGGSNLTGLVAQPAGTEITLCEPSPGPNSLTIVHESASSTAANRFNLGASGNITLNKDTAGGINGPCATFWYYNAGARWLLKSTSASVP